MIHSIQLALVSSLAMLSSIQASSLTMTPLAFASTTSRTSLSTKAASAANSKPHSTTRIVSRLHYQDTGTLEQVASSTSESETSIMTRHIDDSNYQGILQNSYNHPVLVDCYIANCGPCKLIEQSLQSILPKYSHPEEEQQQLISCKWDANKKDNSPQFLNLLRDAKMTFSKLPTLILFVDGEPVALRSGMATGGQLDRFLEENLPGRNEEVEECVIEVNLLGEVVVCEE